MNFRTLPTLWICLATSLLPSFGQAHFLWATLDPKTHVVSVALQEVPTQDPLPLGERGALLKAWLPRGREIALKADANTFKGTAAGGCVGAGLDYGVIDRRDGGRGVFWLKYYAKGATTPEASRIKLGLPVELSATVGSDGKPVITVWKDGRPAEGAAVVVEDAQGKPVFDGKSGADGTVVLLPSQGSIAVRALITDPTPGTHDGHPYELIRAYSTLTVQLASAKAQQKMVRGANIANRFRFAVSDSDVSKTVKTGR